jgi:DNA-binding transcriptional MerR regulator
LTEIEAAGILNVSPRTLQQWRVKGGGPPFQKLGAAVRYDPDALAAWINAQTRSNTSDPGPAAA